MMEISLLVCLVVLVWSIIGIFCRQQLNFPPFDTFLASSAIVAAVVMVLIIILEASYGAGVYFGSG